MELKVSRLKMVTVVLKILTGLGQVVSKQEETMEQKLPGPQWDSDFLNVMKFDASLIIPICEVDYAKRFLLNSVALPLSLILLVAATWATNTPKDKKQSEQATNAAQAEGAGNTPAADQYDEHMQSKRAD